jgi:hypothetical protein
MKKAVEDFKRLVQAHGEYVLDCNEFMRENDEPCWFISRNCADGYGAIVLYGLHHTPYEAWKAAAKALGLA